MTRKSCAVGMRNAILRNRLKLLRTKKPQSDHDGNEHDGVGIGLNASHDLVNGKFYTTTVNGLLSHG